MRSVLESRLSEAPEHKAGPPSIPDHVLLEPIGSGAYGEVWRARSALGTLRAVKIVYRDRFANDRPFQREFHGILKYEPISRTHESFIAILHVGRNDEGGYFYYIMELADNGLAAPGAKAEGAPPGPGRIPIAPTDPYKPRTLHYDLALCRRLPAVPAAQLALRVANALAHLHRHGLVHRDVKPSNIIVVNGQPKLADIGLITTVGDSRSFVGTEGFMPPEGPGSPQADTYALGKLLYEMATGSDRLEFPRISPELAQSPEGNAVLELNEIITRACAPDPGQRYSAATELVADLNLFLSGRSLREARRLERHVVWLKRFAIVACLITILVGLAFLFARTQARQAREREHLSQEQAQLDLALRRRAEAAEKQSRQQLYTALLEQARATVRSGEMGQRVRALEAIQRAGVLSNSYELRSVALAALALPDLRFQREIPYSAEFTAFQLDPAFQRIARCRGTNSLEILSVSDDRLLATLPATSPSPVFIIRWSGDGRFLAVKRDLEGFGDRADLEIWEPATGKLCLVVRNVFNGAFSFHRQDARILTSQPENAVVLWDLLSGKALKRFQLEGEPAFLSFSPAGDRFAAAGQVGQEWRFSVYNSDDGSRLVSRTNADSPSCLDWHPSRDLVLTTDYGGWVRLMDAATGQSRTLGRHKAQAAFATFSPDGDYAVTGGWEREVIFWDLQRSERSFTVSLNQFIAQFQGDGREWAFVTDSAVKVYSLEKPDCHRELGEDLGGRVRHAAFSADGRWLAVPGQEKLAVWDLASEGRPAVVERGANSRLFFSKDSSELYASLDEDCFGYKIVPAAVSGAPPELQSLKLALPTGFTSFCLAADRSVFTTLNGSWVSEFRESGPMEISRAPTSDGVSGASPDGRWLAIFRPYSQELKVYHLPGLELAATLTNRGSIGEFAFSADGEELVVISRTQLDFWKTSTWRQARSLPGFMGILFSNQTGPWWLVKDFQHAGLFEARTLEPILPLPAGVMPLALSPDGKLLAVSVDARRVQLWNLARLHEQLQRLGVDWN